MLMTWSTSRALTQRRPVVSIAMSSGDTAKWWMTVSADRATADLQPASVAMTDGAGVAVMVGVGNGGGVECRAGVWAAGLEHAESVRTVSAVAIGATLTAAARSLCRRDRRGETCHFP